ncbi:MAG: 50S ribosomal protein L13 [Candidatus Woesearchaeota archaeon]
MIVVDAKDCIVGRMATKVAKMALLGQTIKIVNCEQAVFSGTQDVVLAKFQQLRERTVPLKGPYFPKQSHLIVKRNIRGMLPYKSPRGRAAYQRITCYVGVPADLQGVATVSFDTKDKLPKGKFVSVQRVAQHLGGSQ